MLFCGLSVNFPSQRCGNNFHTAFSGSTPRHIRFIPCPIHCVVYSTSENIGYFRLPPRKPELPSRAYSENRRICVSFRSARKGAFSRVVFFFIFSVCVRLPNESHVFMHVFPGIFAKSRGKRIDDCEYGGGCIFRYAEMRAQMRRCSGTSGALLEDFSEAFETRKVQCRIIV